MVAVPVAYNAIHVVSAHWVAQHPTIERSCRHLVGNPCAQSKKNRCGTASSSLNLHPTRHGRDKKEGVRPRRLQEARSKCRTKAAVKRLLSLTMRHELNACE